MCTCNYCLNLYNPRPQVKNQKACQKESCQIARQRDNEREWRERNKIHYGKDYQEQKRDERDNAVLKMIEDIFKCLNVGKEFLDKAINLKEINFNEFKKILICFFSELGIRRLNKILVPITISNST